MEAACDPEVVLVSGVDFPERGEWRGHDGVRGFIEGQAEAFEEMWVEPKEFIDAGDRLVVPARFGGRARHSELEIEFEVIHVWTARGGKIIRGEMFTTRTAALKAVGLDENPPAR